MVSQLVVGNYLWASESIPQHTIHLPETRLSYPTWPPTAIPEVHRATVNLVSYPSYPFGQLRYPGVS